jgi:hypothetical protein
MGCYYSIRKDELAHVMPRSSEKLDLALENGVFTTGPLISVVRDKDFHPAV